MPTVRSIRSVVQIEQDFADALSEFLPKQLVLAKDAAKYPYIREKGFFGYINGAVANFDKSWQVNIHNKKWNDAIIKAIQQYEAKSGARVEVITYY